MLRIKERIYNNRNSKFSLDLDLVVKVNAGGLFYVNVPKRLEKAIRGTGLMIRGTTRKANLESDIDVFADTYEKLHTGLFTAAQLALNPERTVEHIICYNIALHCAFAERKDGSTARNGIDGEWNNRAAFGNHHSSNMARGGYSLCVGAQAMTKVTLKLGDHVETKYENYYKDESHLGTENPAQKLNSWCSFTMPDNCVEIPYTDEAALFFDSMMMGVVNMSRKINSVLGTKEAVLEAIANNSECLLTSG